jgi:hypothetical protein
VLETIKDGKTVYKASCGSQPRPRPIRGLGSNGTSFAVHDAGWVVVSGGTVRHSPSRLIVYLQCMGEIPVRTRSEALCRTYPHPTQRRKLTRR